MFRNTTNQKSQSNNRTCQIQFNQTQTQNTTNDQTHKLQAIKSQQDSFCQSPFSHNQIKVEQPEEISIDPESLNKILPNSIQALIKNSFKNILEFEQRKILDQFISKHPNPLFTSSLKQYPFSPQEPNRRRPKDQQSIKMFVDLNQTFSKLTLYITIINSKRLKHKVDIVGRTGLGETIFYAQSQILEDLSQQMIQIIGMVSSFLIVDNRSLKCFSDCTRFLQVLKFEKSFAWIEHKDNVFGHQTFNTHLQKITNEYVKIQCAQICIIFSSQQEANEVYLNIVKQLMFTIQIDKQIERMFPTFETSNNAFLKYLITNAALISSKYNYKFDIIAVMPLLQEIINSIMNIIHRKESENHQNTHYPVMLNYPKQCIVCKKDSVQAYPPVQRQTVKKTKYGCQGCKQFFGREVRLCVKDCFQTFHDHMAYYISKSGSNICQIALPPPYCKNKSKFCMYQKNEIQSAFENNQPESRSKYQILLNIQKIVNIEVQKFQQKEQVLESQQQYFPSK